MEFIKKARYDIDDLLSVVRILREPGGCPWDQAQTHQSIRQNFIEETYEVADAIDAADAHLLCEELGDVLLQIVLHVQMEQEQNSFTFNDVCDGICKKLIYRHPHVFGSVEVSSAGEVLQNWESLKNVEKGRTTAAVRLDSVPASLPALMYATKMQKRAADYGFAYSDIHAVIADLESEIAELKAAIAQNEAPQNIGQELGDILFSAANVAAFLDVDAEQELESSTKRFAARVKRVEELAEEQSIPLESLDAPTRDKYWKQAKKQQQDKNI